MGDHDAIEKFIGRWARVTGSERANYQLFVTELCSLLGLPMPEPAHEDTRDNAYVFERRVQFSHGDGSTSHGFIDCYRRGHFVLEAKKIKAASNTRGFDDALMRARAQAESYARALPATEGRPPFVVVVDVGHVIEMFAEFTRSGATYTPFPDARSHRVKLADLRNEATRKRLRALWLDPMSLDPARASAKVTREVAAKLAQLAKDLEAAGHASEPVAAFLTRCLFCMFAEDVGLLPKSDDGEGAFLSLLKRWREQPDTLCQMLRVLWHDMDRGGFSPALARHLLHFNGKLFKGSSAPDYVLPLQRSHIDGLLDAAASNWREVEPAIFGTLLERALNPVERHALGAHYTPRAYVERLVLPTVIEPLRADWANAQAAALLLSTEANSLEGKKREDKIAEARAEINRFHHQLCTTRVLDPACGSGNFLYVTLEHLKRLESEVLAQLDALGETQSHLGFAGGTVTPQLLLGIELNERAAALAELVLWIGYLQWHIRSFGGASVAEPVIHDFGNIEHRDAVLAYDSREPLRDAAGQLVQRWDGKTFKAHPVTGEQVPDEGAVAPQWRYVNPRAAEWPAAHFIVGNPPFIGNKRMREALGDGYAAALRSAWPDVPESADLVMYWWAHCATTVASGGARRFGLITTNSIRQVFNRRVVEAQLARGNFSLVFAIADHPWVDSKDGAGVRIAMTVGAGAPDCPGRVLEIVQESEGEHGEVSVVFRSHEGLVGAALSTRVGPASVKPLEANRGISYMGVILCGEGFFIDAPEAASTREVTEREGAVRLYLSGTDLAKRIRGRAVIDLTGLDLDAARRSAPASFQWVLDRVKPVREQSKRRSHKENWWLYGEKRPLMRQALTGLPRYIATARTSKFRVFQFVSPEYLAESNVIVVAMADALHLGVLSSSIHVAWAECMGATLEDRPHYTNSTVFEPFPFPADDTGLTVDLKQRIRTVAEQLDAHRKAQLAAHTELTITGLYNVLQKLRSGEALTAAEKQIHTNGLVSVLKSLHDELDAAVLEAYGWSDLRSMLVDHAHVDGRLGAVGTLLERLVALNVRRASEEAVGSVRWLRPDFQRRGLQDSQTTGPEAGVDSPEDVAVPTAAVSKVAWPSGLPAQIKAVADVLAASPRPMALAEVEARFVSRGRWRDRLPIILDTLEALGRARRHEGGEARWLSP